MAKRRVVITGIGIISPLANNREDTWTGIKSGKSGVAKITRFDASAFSTQIAAEVKNFEPSDYIENKEVKKFDRFDLYALAAANEAVKDAKLPQDLYAPERAGCLFGVGMGGIYFIEKFHNIYNESGPRRISPFMVPGMITNMASGLVSIKHNLKGVNYTLASACSSSTHAVGEAYRMVAEGIQDLMFTGGAEGTITEMSLGGFCSCKALSSRNDEPEKASRPFDKDRDGFVMGEGSAVLILEEYETAKKRKADIYAEIVGYGFSSDAYHITAPQAEGLGAAQAMQMALDWGSIAPEKINYINAHGTSTGANDVMETKGIKKVFGGYAKDGLMISSTKSMTGHLLGAAGGIEIAFSSMAIRDNIVPPTINLDNPDEECDLDYVPNVARKAELNYVMSNSFGFGGTNASLIIARC